MTRRLLLSYLGLTVMILVILEVPLAVLGARHLRDTDISQGQNVATGVAIATSEDFEQGRDADLRNVVIRYRTTTGGEVSIVDATGKLVATADDDGDNDTVGEATPFVHAALRGIPAAGIVHDEHAPVVVATSPIGESGTRTGAVVLLISAQLTEHRVHLFWTALAGFAVVTLLVALAVGRWMTGVLSKPLERLGVTVSALDETNLGARASTDDGPIEIRTLAQQFNQMAHRLTELVRAQGYFVADASHQLRSPLTALRLRIENLEADLPVADRASVAAIGAEVQRLSRLVDGLVSLGHADAVSPERSTVDVDQVIDERCRAWAALAQERRITLEPPAPVPSTAATSGHQALLVPGDLDQILDNLLANALDASPADGRITVERRDLAPTGSEIHIIDQGPGMSDEQRDRAFDRFWQGSTQRGSRGGLGLAIVRQLGLRNELDVRLTSAAGGGLDAVVGLPQSRHRRSGRQVLRT